MKYKGQILIILNGFEINYKSNQINKSIEKKWDFNLEELKFENIKNFKFRLSKVIVEKDFTTVFIFGD